MATLDLIPSIRPREEDVFVARKRFKTSDLPLNSTQRSTIDSLLHTIKKKGEYDALRKKVWSEYAETDDKKAFTSSLNELAESEADRDPSLLSRDRGKAATLMQGAVDRSDIYKSVELSLDKLIAAHIGHLQEAGREIRKVEVGEEAAAEEEKRGSKTDEEYAKESTVRREAREEIRKKEEARKRREEEIEKLRAEEKKKKLELEKLRRADERRREEEAKEIKREQERAAQQAAAKQLEEEKEAVIRQRYERHKREELERGRESERSWHQTDSHSHDRLRSSHRDAEPPARHREIALHATPKETHHSPVPVATTPAVDEKALEKAALELLLREGRELAAKNTTTNPPTRSESIEPPIPRKPHLSSRTSGTPIEPHPGPKLSYSTTNVPSRPRSAHHSHSRHHDSKDRSHSRHTHRHHHRSRSRSTSHRHSARHDLSPAAKAVWKAKASAQRERDAEVYKRARSRSPTHDRGYQHHHHETARRYSTRSPSRERAEPRERGERSARGEREGQNRERAGERYAQRRGRDRSPVDIDRYIPGGGSSRVVAVSGGHRESERESGGHRERERDRGEREARGHREGEREGRGHRESGHREGGGREGRPHREGERDRERGGYVEIDRYVPGRGERER